MSKKLIRVFAALLSILFCSQNMSSAKPDSSSKVVSFKNNKTTTMDSTRLAFEGWAKNPSARKTTTNKSKKRSSSAPNTRKLKWIGGIAGGTLVGSIAGYAGYKSLTGNKDSQTKVQPKKDDKHPTLGQKTHTHHTNPVKAKNTVNSVENHTKSHSLPKNYDTIHYFEGKYGFSNMGNSCWANAFMTSLPKSMIDAILEVDQNSPDCTPILKSLYQIFTKIKKNGQIDSTSLKSYLSNGFKWKGDSYYSDVLWDQALSDLRKYYHYDEKIKVLIENEYKYIDTSSVVELFHDNLIDNGGDINIAVKSIMSNSEFNIPFNTLLVKLPNALAQDAYAEKSDPTNVKKNGLKIEAGNLAGMKNYQQIEFDASKKILLNNKKNENKLLGSLKSIGLCNGGHWWTFTFSGEKIYEHNDSTVKEITRDGAKKQIEKYASYLVYDIRPIAGFDKINNAILNPGDAENKNLINNLIMNVVDKNENDQKKGI